jgi:hypothetical protein
LLRALLERGQCRGLLAEQIDQRAPLAALRIDLFEPRDRVGVGLDLDDPLERLDRIREVAEAIAP